VPVVELGTGPATFELLPTFWPFQPVVLTFCAVLPVSQPNTIPQETRSKRTEALNMVSPWKRFYMQMWEGKKRRKDWQNRPWSSGANIQTGKLKEKTAFGRLFLRNSWLQTTEPERSLPANP
jgi:hypothetical protein